MPYNTAAIVPTEEVTGSAILPLARVKKTINADEDIGNVSAQASFLICKATEMFVQYATEKSHDMAKAEAKPKRSLTYSHVANAVARTDNLEFLSDIAPQTTTWRMHKAAAAANAAGGANTARRGVGSSIDPKQARLDGEYSTPWGVSDPRNSAPTGAQGSSAAPPPHPSDYLMNTGTAVDQGANGKVNGERKARDGEEDVEMS